MKIQLTEMDLLFSSWLEVALVEERFLSLLEQPDADGKRGLCFPHSAFHIVVVIEIERV